MSISLYYQLLATSGNGDMGLQGERLESLDVAKPVTTIYMFNLQAEGVIGSSESLGPTILRRAVVVAGEKSN